MKRANSQNIEQLIYEMELRNYSPRTIHTYTELLGNLEKYFQTELEKVSTEQLKAYLYQRMKVDEVSVSFINQTISAFKLLHTDVLKRDWETFRIKRPRREKKLPVVLSQEEVELLISSTRNIKHKALIMLAYSSGLRRQEVQQIKPSAIDSARMQVRVVQGKGTKDRYTILSKKTLELLRFYYRIEKPSVYLFEPQGQKGITLSDTTLNNIVQKNAKKAGIKKDISFHTLRHCFATHLLEQGVNLKIIQQFLGHNSLKTTSIYLSVANINLSSVVSPLDSMDV
jgi:site-specific recombinase XerD